MKKSELRKLIKEVITEQSGIYIGYAINYDQNAGAQSMNFQMCQCEIIDAALPGTSAYVDLNTGCCNQSITISADGNYHGNGGQYDITTKSGGIFWTAIQNAQAGNTSGHQGIYADLNHCLDSCPSTVDLANPNVLNPNFSGDGCYQNGTPACSHAQTGPPQVNVSGAGTPNLVNPVQQPPATFAPSKVADPQLDPSTLPDTSARGAANSRMQKLANIKPRRK